jgi:hypothetical protein
MEYHGSMMSESAPKSPASALDRPTFSLGAMLLLVTVFSIGLTLIARMPQLGMVVLISLVPAYVRTLIAIRVEHRQGQATSLLEKIEHLIYSILMVVVLYMVAFGIAAGVTLLGLFLNGIFAALQDKPFPEPSWSDGYQMMLACVGMISALIVTLRLFWRWWPRAHNLTRKEYM